MPIKRNERIVKMETIKIENANVLIDRGNNTIKITSGQSLNTSNLSVIVNIISNKVAISSLNVGDVCKIGDEEFIILDKEYATNLQGNKHGVAIIRKDLMPSEKFGDNADWKQSPIMSKLNDSYLDMIENEVGKDNILPFHRDLTSLDGLDDYRTNIDKISLLTAAEYAKYHKVLGLKLHYSNWWWTITPGSTPSNDCARCVCCVNSNGALVWYVCGCCNGVRPFLILKSSTLVSLKEND